LEEWIMMFRKTMLASAALIAFAGSASAVTVNFTQAESPGVVCCGLIASDAYAAYGLTVNDAYWYADNRDTFDGEGISIRNRPTASIVFNGGSNGVTFQYWVIGGNRGTYEAFDASNVSLGMLAVDATNGDVLGTHSFTGAVARLDYSGVAGFTQVSAVTFAPIPEPSTYALMALGLAGIGFVARRRRAA
jgi:hypothetical protein